MVAHSRTSYLRFHPLSSFLSFVHQFRVLRFGYPWMIVWAIGVYYLWAVTLLVNQQVGQLTILVGLNWFVKVGISPHALAVFLIFAASAALLGLLLEPRALPRPVLALLLPQYGLMLAAFLSDAQFIIRAVNPVTQSHIDRWLLLAILGPMMFAGFLHTLSIIERFVLEPRRN